MCCTPRRKYVLQKEHLTLPLVVCSLEAFERILLIWLDATELFIGGKTTLLFLLWFVTDFRSFNQQAAWYHREQSPIKHKNSSFTKACRYWLCLCLMSFLWHISFYVVKIKVNVLAFISHLSILLTRQCILCLSASSILAPEAENDV